MIKCFYVKFILFYSNVKLALKLVRCVINSNQEAINIDKLKYMNNLCIKMQICFTKMNLNISTLFSLCLVALEG